MLNVNMNTDYHAKLTIHNWNTLDKRTRKRVIAWLMNTAQWLQEEDQKQISSRFTARLMK